MKVGIFLPLVGGSDAASLRDFLTAAARAAEEAGFHSLWFPEHVVLFDQFESRYPYSADGSLPIPPGLGMLEPFSAIAFAAAVTSKIRLGTGICLVPQRPPIYTAKVVADCDVLSGGRVDFGVGIGWLREEFEALGVEFEGRATRTREYLAAMKSLWMDDVSEHKGHLLQIPPLRMFPKPVQKPHPPIVFGGHSDRALRRVADLGDGWFAFDLLPDEVKAPLEELNGVLSRRGRRPDAIEVTVSPYMKPARDAASLRAYAEAGVDQVVQVVFGATPDDVAREIEALAAELIPVARSLEPRRRPHH
jgi:probable F420-dependent oxidoreductase